jgi:hypothetical protein
MKIKGEDFENIKALALAGEKHLSEVLGRPSREAFEQRDERIPRIGLARDTLMRWRWDCMWTGARIVKEFGVPCNYDDSNIDTALRKALP